VHREAGVGERRAEVGAGENHDSRGVGAGQLRGRKLVQRCPIRLQPFCFLHRHLPAPVLREQRVEVAVPRISGRARPVDLGDGETVRHAAEACARDERRYEHRVIANEARVQGRAIGRSHLVERQYPTVVRESEELVLETRLPGAVAPRANEVELSAHVADARDAIRDEQRERRPSGHAEVHVHVPESGDHVGPACVDGASPASTGRRARRYRADAIVLDDHCAIRLHGATLDIDDADMGDRNLGRRARRENNEKRDAKVRGRTYEPLREGSSYLAAVAASVK